MNTPAGWYPQPDGQQRYWDGEQWTESFAPGGPPVTPAAAVRKNWFLRHKVITAVGAVLLLVIVAGIVGGGANKTVNIAPAAAPVVAATTPDQAALDQAAADQAAASKAAADQAVADQAAADKAAADQAVIDKAAAEKAAADKKINDVNRATRKAVADKAAKAAAPAVEVFTMPSLVGENLQLAQDKLQALGSYLMDQQDAAGLGRIQVIDSNWQVCTQDPAPGATVPADTMVTLAAVKLAEQCP